MSEPTPTVALQLRVQGRRCVVVGAGGVGVRRALALLDAGARVRVVAPQVDPRLDALLASLHEPGSDPRPDEDLDAEQGAAPPDAGGLELLRREFRADDLDGALLVVVATGVPEVDAEVTRAARERNVLVNHASEAASGDVSFPATVRRGEVTFAVATGGRAPAVARWVAARLDANLDEITGLDAARLDELVDLVAEVRAELRAGDGPAPGDTLLNWREALDKSILDLIGTGRRAEAKERLLACLSSS